MKSAPAHTVVMSFGQIVGYAIIKALRRDQEAAARTKDAAVSRAAMDEEELRDVEYASMGLPVPVRGTAARSKRSVLRRIIRP